MDAYEKDILADEALLDAQENRPGAAQALLDNLGAAPWWIVSGSFHALLLLLLTLIGMAIFRPTAQEIVIDTSLVQDPPPKEEEPRKPALKPQPVTFESEQDPVENLVFVHEQMEVAEQAETMDNMNTQMAKGEEDKISDVDFAGQGVSAALGLNGGGGGKYGTRFGGDKNRALRNGGGGPATEDAVKNALRWLAKHQEPDGHWDTSKYASRYKTDTACTGFALLAFLGAGHTEKVGEFKDHVRRATKWLISRQQDSGLVFDSTDAGGHRGTGYPHAIAGMALAEAAGMGRSEVTKAAAQKAIDYSVNVHQQGDGSEKLGWRYQPKSPADLSVSGWFVMQLKSAKAAGLHVDPGSFEGAIRFLDSVEHKAADAYGGSTYWYQTTNEHAASAHRLTAIGTLCRQFLGWKKEDLEGSVNLFVNKGGVPKWDANGSSVDLYYWYYGTLCAFQQGGPAWKDWNEAMKKAFCENQRQGGDEDGSWDPVGAYSDNWGRVGQTALGCLCLEVYYRYLPMYK
ncbi:MAG: terpene cyclase/mutase family protein [Planctomycetota bacterium]|nr:terpene cyclase/mutase family protein [Planctomycetota bacterium]